MGPVEAAPEYRVIVDANNLTVEIENELSECPAPLSPDIAAPAPPHTHEGGTAPFQSQPPQAGSCHAVCSWEMPCPVLAPEG